MVKPPLRTKSIGFKVSEEEYAQLETAAQASGRTLGEWCREVILRGGPASDDPALAEIVGVRLLLVNVLRPLAAGAKPAPEAFDKMLDQISEVKHELAAKLQQQAARKKPQPEKRRRVPLLPQTTAPGIGSRTLHGRLVITYQSSAGLEYTIPAVFSLPGELPRLQLEIYKWLKLKQDINRAHSEKSTLGRVFRADLARLFTLGAPRRTICSGESD